MTPTEKAIVEALNSLTIAVSDLGYAQHTAARTRRGEEGDSAPLRELEGYLETAERQLKTVRTQLTALGVRH